MRGKEVGEGQEDLLPLEEAEAIVAKIGDPRLTLTEGGSFRIDQSTSKKEIKDLIVPRVAVFYSQEMGEEVPIEQFLRGLLDF